MKRLSHIKGFAIVEVLLIIVILGIIAFVAWRVIDATGTVDETANQAAGSNVIISDSEVPAANNSKDLDTLNKQLDAAEVEDDTELNLQSETTF